MAEEVKMDSAGNDKLETGEHRPGDQSGSPVTTRRPAGEVTNWRETGKGRRTGADALRPPHYALTDITEKANPSLVTQGRQTVPGDSGHWSICHGGKTGYRRRMA